MLLAAGGLLCAAGLGPCTDGMRFAAGAEAATGLLASIAAAVLLWQLEPAILAALLPIVLAGGVSEPLPVALRPATAVLGTGWLLSRRLR